MPGYEVIGEEELEEVTSVFKNGGVLFRHGFDTLRGDSYKVMEFEEKFAKKMKSNFALAVTSGTAALRVALASIDITAGDEVIAPAFTFVATIESIIESRAIPVCAEVDRTLNLDPADLKSKITSKTKAVIVVHMLGTPARLSEISKICKENKLILIEDTAWGCGGALQNTPLGTWGDIGTYSFDFAKTMTTGEGGMVVFKDKLLFDKAAAWHDHGHENNPAVPRWEDTRSGSGFNYRMMELQGAIGIVQLKKLTGIVEAQRKNFELLWGAISDCKGVELRKSPDGSYETNDALVFFVENSEIALNIRTELLKVGMSTKILPEAYTWHFAGTWSHMPELKQAHGGSLIDAFPRSEALLTRSVSIPVTVNMPDENPIKLREALRMCVNE